MIDDKPTLIKPKTEDKPKLTNGGRNLLLLGLGAILVTFLVTFVALKIYHDSGDIYLDRSRPGFLPEKDEAESEVPSNYELKDSGPLTSELLDEYLESLKQEINRLNDFSSEPFDPAPLSDQTLGL